MGTFSSSSQEWRLSPLSEITPAMEVFFTHPSKGHHGEVTLSRCHGGKPKRLLRGHRCGTSLTYEAYRLSFRSEPFFSFSRRQWIGPFLLFPCRHGIQVPPKHGNFLIGYRPSALPQPSPPPLLFLCICSFFSRFLATKLALFSAAGIHFSK